MGEAKGKRSQAFKMRWPRRSCVFFKCKKEFQPKAENQKFHVGECRMRTFYIKKEGGPYAIMQNEWEVALKTAELTRLKEGRNGS